MVYGTQIPDALDMFHEDDRRKEHWRESRPLCALCDHRIQEPFYYEIDCEKVCKHCLEMHFKREVEIE